MKLSLLLESSSSQLTLSTRAAALELQQLLLDMPNMELDVELSKEPIHGKLIEKIALEYKDKNNLIRGAIILQAVQQATAISYQAVKMHGSFGPLYFNSKGFDVSMILFEMIKEMIMYEPFVNDIKSLFGTTEVNLKPTREGCCATIHPPFTVRSIPHTMVHNTRIIQFVELSITPDATIKVEIIDSNGDAHSSEVDKLVNIHKPIKALLDSAADM